MVTYRDKVQAALNLLIMAIKPENKEEVTETFLDVVESLTPDTELGMLKNCKDPILDNWKEETFLGNLKEHKVWCRFCKGEATSSELSFIHSDKCVVPFFLPPTSIKEKQ